MARGEDRRDGAPLPAPVGAFRGEQAVAHGRAQHPQHDLGFRVVVDVVEVDSPQCLGALHHVPARRAGGAGDDGLGVGNGRNDVEDVAAHRAQARHDSQGLAGRRDGGRNEV